LQLDYQVTQDLVKMHTDIRFKLLAILPPIGAASVALVSAQAVGLSPFSMFAVGTMGFFLTLGFVLYDLRNSDLYNACVHRAKLLEGVMGFVRQGNETIVTSRSLEASILQGAALIAKKPNMHAAPDHKRVGWPGGAHRQRAVSYLRFLGFQVNHGSALSLVYGVVLGAWTFPLAKGLFVGLGNLWVVSLKMGRPFSEGSGVTSLSAFLVAGVGTFIFWRALNATDAPNAVHGLYPEAELKGKDKEQQDSWSQNAKKRAAQIIAAKTGRSWITAVVAVDPGCKAVPPCVQSDGER
jgi:hypothetical protein